MSGISNIRGGVGREGARRGGKWREGRGVEGRAGPGRARPSLDVMRGSNRKVSQILLHSQ